MCGVIAATSFQVNIIPSLLDGLAAMEYRGYDSAGVAWLSQQKLQRLRSVGRVADLTDKSAELTATIGIAHTRWATHGVPSEKNAHPHVSSGFSVVHNGIIENYSEIKQSLIAASYIFTSDTDSEVIAHLLAFHEKKCQDFLEALRLTTLELKGAYAIAAIAEKYPQQVLLARHGSPLIICQNEHGCFAASDVTALIKQSANMTYLENGELALLTPSSFRLIDQKGAAITRKAIVSEVSSEAVSLGNYQHFMQKEIFEQGGSLANTLEVIAQSQTLQVGILGAQAEKVLQDIDSILIIACGTSYYAGLVAKYWLESIAKISCNVEVASEYRYRQPVTPPRQLVIAMSQSGETADTLAALKFASEQGNAALMAICNVAESSLVRLCSLRLITRAGPEIGVASTKAFTTQLASLFLFSLVVSKIRQQLKLSDEQKLLQQLRHLPLAVEKVLAAEFENQVKEWAIAFSDKQHALFLGRGIHYPIALEGALKLKELSYIHAEAYPAGELKHGPLALVDSNMPIIAIAPNDSLLEKLNSNLQEVRARGGKLYVFADADSKISEDLAADSAISIIRLPEHYGLLSPIIHVIPLQLLAYHIALVKGTDVDKPRNLAKSVTVE